MVLGQEAEVGEKVGVGAEPFDGAVGGAVIDDDDLVLPGVGLGFEGGEALLEDGLAVVGGDDDAEEHTGGGLRENKLYPV